MSGTDTYHLAKFHADQCQPVLLSLVKSVTLNGCNAIQHGNIREKNAEAANPRFNREVARVQVEPQR